MREGIAFLAFTDRGEALAEKLAGVLGGETARAGRDLDLGTWTEAAFREKRALIYVGAVGIAVRAIAPFLRHKAEDPAVLAVDETGRYVIPLLSGHLGGANALARKLAAVTGGEAVITTATDLHGVFAVDLWAKKQNMTVRQPARIRSVSAKLLAGQMILLDCRWKIHGAEPENVRRTLSVQTPTCWWIIMMPCAPGFSWSREFCTSASAAGREPVQRCWKRAWNASAGREVFCRKQSARRRAST